MSRYIITKKHKFRKLKNKSKSKKISRSKNTTKSKTTSKNKSKKQNIKKQNGGNNVSLDIKYNDITISGQQLTKEQTANQPSITIKNENTNTNTNTNTNPNSRYLITMTDPDAPNGEGNQGNHTWTHWVLTYNGINNNIDKIYVPYTGPSPPVGTHRYIFNLYDVSNITNLDELNFINNDRSNYYENILKNKINKINNFIPISTTQFTVSAQ
jgi:phosphatidylethanolamine-binding protein (PEBP) family uncharacterized protein